jgi:predicted amidohydrolase YtcJ
LIQKIKYIFILIFLLKSYNCIAQDNESLALVNAKIVTVDSTLPEAQALWISGDRISVVGSNNEIAKYISRNTQVIDLKGKLVVPGFIDGHAHFLGLGYAKMNMDLTKVKNWTEVIGIVKEAVKNAEPGQWIIGRGWHQEKWDKLPEQMVEGYPVHLELSKISPNNPVILTHASGHALFANAKAMELAGIGVSTIDPEGGRIVRQKNGQPSGIFLENAEKLINDVYKNLLAQRTPDQKEADIIKAIVLASDECLRKGITSFQDASQPYKIIDIYKKLADQGRLNTRLWVMIDESNDSLIAKIDQYKILGYGNNFLTIRSIKRYMDGALGARGAWLLEPYADLSSTSGLNTVPLDQFMETARIAIEHGFQLCTHAIGDRANREVLNIYEEVFKNHPDKTNLRWRIEHAQHLHPQDIPRFAELGVIASMQGIHCTSDAPWIPKRLGDKRAEEGAYVWKKLINTGAIISNGTDAPVEDVDPIANYYALVTRKTKDGKAFYPEQKLSREEALKLSTLNCAYAAFEEDIKGSITVGKLADIVVLSQDILTIPDEQIKQTRVLYTILGGKIKFQDSEIQK